MLRSRTALVVGLVLVLLYFAVEGMTVPRHTPRVHITHSLRRKRPEALGERTTSFARHADEHHPFSHVISPSLTRRSEVEDNDGSSSSGSQSLPPHGGSSDGSEGDDAHGAIKRALDRGTLERTLKNRFSDAPFDSQRAPEKEGEGRKKKKIERMASVDPSTVDEVWEVPDLEGIDPETIPPTLPEDSAGRVKADEDDDDDDDDDGFYEGMCESLAAKRCKGLMYSFAEFLTCAVRRAEELFGPAAAAEKDGGAEPHVCHANFIRPYSPCVRDMVLHCGERDSGSTFRCLIDDHVVPALSAKCRRSFFHHMLLHNRHYVENDDVHSKLSEDEKQRKKEVEMGRQSHRVRILSRSLSVDGDNDKMDSSGGDPAEERDVHGRPMHPELDEL